MQKVFFTADSHWGHANIMRYCDRDFPSVHDMNKEMTRAWNSTVGPNDQVWHLGDLAMDKRKVASILDR